VVELNGAVDFRPVYARRGRDIYADVVAALSGSARASLEPAA
jgi:hypothetical protein